MMHLVGPWLSTTGKKKGKKKFISADQKRKLEQLALSQKEMYKKYGIKEEPVARKSKPTFSTLSVNSYHPRYVDQQHIPSLNNNTGDTTLRESMKYTGERKLLGVAVMHKSNLVPIFDQKEAEEIAQMRR